MLLFGSRASDGLFSTKVVTATLVENPFSPLIAMLRPLLATICVMPLVAFSWGEEPANLDPQIKTLLPGVKLSIVAEHPDVMTPTGIDVDDSGDVWFVCSHTHFRPEDYQGPEHDEVVVMRDGKRHVFYDKTTATMDLELGPKFAEDGWVYLAQRDRILRVRDTDGDLVGDEEQEVAVLETEGTYPHNGLSGMAWQTNGDLVFALGENHWTEWTLSSHDGSSVTGTGEGGIFRCRPDGSELRRIAKGFWNPFGICVRSDSTMFVCENDPGARPPCRLLHIVEGGDYGYQRLYGNAPHHPFVCWDGELPGTLPMLFSVGEAPCGIAPLGNGLLVTSWTDHRIDFYPLQSNGASFETQRVPLVSGSLDFRPTCIVQQNPTTFFLTDWVVGSYQLHKKGRVWKLEIDPTAEERFQPQTIPPATQQAKLAASLHDGSTTLANEKLFELAAGEDAVLARGALDALSRQIDKFQSGETSNLSATDRISLLLAIRVAAPKDEAWARHFLSDKDQSVAFEALRWIADENMTSFAEEVDTILTRSDITFRLFEAALAAKNILAGEPRKGVVDQETLFAHVMNEEASNETRAYAMRLIKPDYKPLHKELKNLLMHNELSPFYREVIRAVGQSEAEAAQELLQYIGGFTIERKSEMDYHPEICLEALAGMRPDPKLTGALIERFDQLLQHPTSRDEALRYLRSTQLTESQKQTLRKLKANYPASRDLLEAAVNPQQISDGRPPVTDIDAWRKRLAAIKQPVDIEAGRRIFHHHSIGTCSKCHRHDGRGGIVGPDLSAVSTKGDPDRLLVALLQPSRDVDPQYFSRTLLFEDGKTFTGIMLRDGGGGKEFYRDSDGREKRIDTKDVVRRKELKTSLMPDGLIDTMTDREIRDLLAFLDAPPEAQ